MTERCKTRRGFTASLYHQLMEGLKLFYPTEWFDAVQGQLRTSSAIKPLSAVRGAGNRPGGYETLFEFHFTYTLTPILLLSDGPFLSPWTGAINRSTGLWVPTVNSHWLLQVNIMSVEMKMPSRLSTYEMAIKFAHSVHVLAQFLRIKFLETWPAGLYEVVFWTFSRQNDT